MINYPKTTEEQINKMLERGVNRNWINRVATENGIDYDEDTKDEFNRNNIKENE